MSVQPVAWPEPDPQVAAAIGAKYRGRRPRPLAALIRDRLGEWLGDEDFAAAFGVRGRPGWSPSRLALVTVLQRAENLTDRQAAESVRTRIDWQYLLGLPLDDAGFDHTVLAEFRARVAGVGLEQVVLDALLERLVAEGLVKAGGKQRTDSTHVVAAVAALHRLELAGESVRAALEALVAAHPALDVLRQVLLQNYTRTITADGREVIRRRENEPEGDGLPPGRARIASPYDTHARWGVKREEFWLGYKLHITQTCDDPRPCTCLTEPAAQQAAAGHSGQSGRGHEHDREHGKGCAQLVFPT